jgi:ABC-type Na+ efflux pump permease subunit
MTFLPIVARELRVAARRRGTYWVRTGAGLVLVAVGSWVFIMMRHDPPPTVTAVLFGSLTAGAILYALGSGVRSTADCLSEEKREGTLGLLFLTDLRGYDIILGKLAASSLNAAYGLLSVVPMLAIPLLMGGVTPGEWARMALVAVNTLFWSLSVGMFISALCRSGQRAATVTLLIILLLAAGLPLCGALFVMFGKTNKVNPLLLLTSPGSGFYLAFDSQYKLEGDWFWVSLAAQNALGWLCLILASLVVPRCWQDRPAGGQGLRWRERWQLWSYGATGDRTAFRRRLLEQNPFFWLASRVRLKTAFVWGFLGLLACVWLAGLAKFRRDWLSQLAYVLTGLSLNLILRCWFAGEASRQLAEERRNGSLELLLSTPLSVRDILKGQWLALQRQFLWPIGIALGLECLFLFLGAPELGINQNGWALFWCAVMAMFVADLVALYWVATWQGLIARNPARASSASLALVIGVPWGVIALVMLASVLWSSAGRSSGDPAMFFLGLWFSTGLLGDIIFGVQARNNLLRYFRVAAQPRYGRGTRWRAPHR